MIWFLAYCVVGVIALLLAAMYKSSDRDVSDFLALTALDFHTWILLPFWPVIVVFVLIEPNPEESAELPQNERAGPDQTMVGKIGITSSALRPAGHARFDGKNHEVMAESGLIDRGVDVRVVEVSGSILKVSPVDPADQSS